MFALWLKSKREETKQPENGQAQRVPGTLYEEAQIKVNAKDAEKAAAELKAALAAVERNLGF